MQNLVSFALALALALPSALAAQVVVRPHDPAASGRPLKPRSQSFGILGEKVDQPADILFVPFYEVDTLHPSGTTTLFAIRDTTTSPVTLNVLYLSPTGDLLREDQVNLLPQQTLTTNIRDVGGLATDVNGVARGYAAVVLSSMVPTAFNLVGDYLQVDTANNFAAGDRMVSFFDLCDTQEIRFLDFGAGTELRFLLGGPQGSDPMSDPPSFTVTPFDENGFALPSSDVYTSQYALELPASSFTTESFGTLVFDLSNSAGGVVYAEYSAEGKFSVGMNGACTEP